MIMNRCRVFGRGRREAEVPVECDSSFVLGMNRKGAHADHIGNLKVAPERIEQQSGTEAAPHALV